MNHAGIVERIHHGRSTIVIGGMPELPETIAVVRVRCDLPGRLGPLDRARDRIERLLDGETPPRSKVIGDDVSRSSVERFVIACNRLAARAPGHVVLALEGLDLVDESVHHALAQLLREPARFRLPLLLVVRGDVPASFREIVDALEGEAPSPAPSRPVASGDLDATDRRVLRAAAVAGDRFSVDALARLLSLSADVVLESLQRARDAGIRVDDAGDGRLSVDPSVAKPLAASVLPSLRARWRERLGARAESTPRAEGALGERLDAIARLVRGGDVKRASDELGGVLDAIDALPSGAETSMLAARAMLERARLRWLGAGIDPALSLDGALEEAVAARAALGDAAPAKLRADAAAVIAGIAYDLGDGASIERAEAVLTETIAALLRDGATNDAAMLLNDEAALELRIGRATKARDLAGRSLDLLGARVAEAPNDAAARADLASTHHLLARLPLHASAGPITAEGLASALAHAADAESAYRALGMRRDVGRVTETRARLEAKRGDLAAARVAFETALRLADESADLTGLARITAGLAELLADTGKPRDALGLLASSIELNREKASPVGLAFDERALARIEDAIFASRSSDAELAAELERTRARLARAMEMEGTR